ncbi:SDR family oxidoreductase [Nocardioides sp. ChNu-153]|uniref:SDR family oxidoreductase n=1 Tax=unclassified Nocardioides TaxID=2615069 RepID=UPI0024068845|nr:MULTISPECIES: SDR family oxidoreductase [unclassified Nocardioides]MDF9715123.1 SDR family oxidoreductase [Nocardioides sp. ChNu-99]MDN7121098.1 SDR family oxidoreductase [Nocardioides sp. ChNu-153]
MSDARTIVITGASSGLGAEMARQFADLGYDLGLCARRTDRLDELRSEILARHPERRVEVRALDVTDDDAVFTVVHDLARALGRIDRFIVNAGLGKGAQLGTGKHRANRQTAVTNFLGALAQTEAALEVFRTQGDGHLVMVSSMSAMRGLPGSTTTYAATKAGVAHLAEGVRADVYGSDIKVTVLYPGFITSEMNDGTGGNPPMIVSTEKGVRAMVAAIEKEKASACVPPLPWAPMSVVLKHAPLGVLRKLV